VEGSAASVTGDYNLPMLRSTLRVLPLFLLLAAAAAADEKGEVFHKERAEVAPFPREVGLGRQIELKVRPAEDHTSPVITVTAPDGSTEYYRPYKTDGDGFQLIKVDLSKGRGAYRFEVVVDSSRGDTTAAQFTIWVGVKKPEGDGEEFERRPDSAYPPEPDDVHVLVLERKLFRLVNDYRRKRGVSPYPWLEKVAELGRAHLLDYLKMSPRPKELTHLIPSYGAIADRFEDHYAERFGGRTIRKFPVAHPDVGPTAENYLTESLGAMRSVDWLFKEYFLRESAFRKPVLSKYPTHAAVAMVRDEKTEHLFSATIYVQVNSTKIRKDLEEEMKETVRQESRARDPNARALFLRKLGRLGDPKTVSTFRRRLGGSNPPEVRAAALDALLLNAPELYDDWRKDQGRILEKARRDEDYADALPVLEALARLEWDPAARRSAEREVRFVTRLSEFELEAAEESLAKGDREAAIEHLKAISRRFPGLPVAERAAERLKELAGE